MTRGCSIAKFWIVFLLLNNITTNASFTSSPLGNLNDSSPSGNTVCVNSSTPDTFISTGLSTIECNFLDVNLSENPTQDVVVKTARSYSEKILKRFFDSLGCPKLLMDSLEESIKLCKTDSSELKYNQPPEVVLKSMLIYLLDDDFSEKYLKLLPLSSPSSKNAELDDLRLLMKMNVLVMLRRTVSSKTFIRIFSPFIKTFSAKFLGQRLDLALIWTLEVVANQIFFLKKSKYKMDNFASERSKLERSKFGHMMNFIETEFSKNEFTSGILSQEYQITYTSLRIEYYLEIDNIDMVNYILSSESKIPMSKLDLFIISELVFLERKSDIFVTIFESHFENLDFSMLLSSEMIVFRAHEYLKQNIPKITELKLNPEHFDKSLSLCLWISLKNIFSFKASMEEIVVCLLKQNIYNLAGKAFSTESFNIERLSNEIVSENEDNNSLCNRILKNIAGNISVKACPKLRQFFISLISDRELNTIILEVMFDFKSSLLLFLLTQISSGLVDLFDLAIELKDYSALTNICSNFRIEKNGEVIESAGCPNRLVQISDHMIHIVNEADVMCIILI